MALNDWDTDTQEADTGYPQLSRTAWQDMLNFLRYDVYLSICLQSKEHLLHLLGQLIFIFRFRVVMIV